MQVSDLTPTEMFESLTGFEEIGITKAFGDPIATLSDRDALTFARALVFADIKRRGASHDTAREAAMELTIKAVQDYFADEPEDPMPEDPESESGKDAS